MEPSVGKKDRTRAGVFLLMLASVVWWIPGIYAYAAIFAIPAFVLIYRDRAGHGEAHSTLVRWAGLATVLGYLIGAVSSAIIDIALGAALMASSPNDPRLFSVTFVGFASSVLIVTFITGLAPVLVTMGIQNRLGRALLWLAFSANVLVQVTAILIEAQAVPGYASQLISGGGTVTGPAAFGTFLDQFSYLQWFGVIPASLEAVAYLRLFLIGELPTSRPQKRTRTEVLERTRWARRFPRCRELGGKADRRKRGGLPGGQERAKR